MNSSLSIFNIYPHKATAITPIIMYGNNFLELRSTSIKGIIRWWYRFFKSSFLDIDKLQETENMIFGSTENSSSFYLLITNTSQENKKDAYLRMNDKNPKNGKIVKKLAFYPPFSFEIKLKFLTIGDKYIQEIKNSLLLLSLFGGIGSRIRRGFGSIQFDNFNHEFFNEDNFDKIKLNIQQKLKNLRGNKNNNQFMNISNTKIYLVKSKNAFWNNWEEAMNSLRDNFYRKLKRELNIDKIVYIDKHNNKKYRSSPLFIQIKKTNNNKYFGVILVWKDICNKINSNFFEKLQNILKNYFDYWDIDT